MISPKLDGKVALITGTNNPYWIGAFIAKALAAQNVKVFLHNFRSHRDQKMPDANNALGGEAFYHTHKAKAPGEVLEAIHQMGGQAETSETDLSIPNNIPVLFEKAEAAFGPVNILVNNAAHWEADTFLPSSKDL